MRDEYRKKCRKAKHESWKQKMNQLDNIKEVARLQKLFESDRVQSLGSIKDSNGTYTANFTETIKNLLETHFSECFILDSLPDESFYNPNRFQDSVIFEILNEKKIIESVCSFKPYKSPGPDEIYPALLINSIKHIPKCWMEAKVVFIPKPGKGDNEKPNL